MKEPRATEAPARRCACYGRKSDPRGLEQDFNTLDAQREACESYVRSQAGLGWTVVPTQYDDGGFTGANMERPALQRLLDDVDRGLVDVVVVYKVDRISRSILDFVKIMERLEKRKVAFVSVTQHFDTSSSMGRLILNILISFSQFEREMISERTRDKIAAARRRGKWTGAQAMLGYQVDRERKKLVVDPDESKVVELAFDLYERTRSCGLVAGHLNALGHPQKIHRRQSGKTAGGAHWDKKSVHRLLSNPIYAGRVAGRDGTLFIGEHEALIPLDRFEKIQRALRGRSNGKTARHSTKGEFLLGGLLRCEACDASMTSSKARGRTGAQYRYYRCCHELKTGSRCPTGLLAADDIEAAVVARVAEVARQGDVERRVLAQIEQQGGADREKDGRASTLRTRLRELEGEAKRLLDLFTSQAHGSKTVAARLVELEAEADRLRSEIEGIERSGREAQHARADLRRAADLLRTFEPVWTALVPPERRELLRLLVDRVVVDPRAGQIKIRLHDLNLSSAGAAA